LGSPFGQNELVQLAEKNTVTISGLEQFILGSSSGNSNTGDGIVTDIAATATSPTKIASSLTLIDASATPAGWILLPVPQTRAALAPSTMAQALTQYGGQAGGNGAQETIRRLDRQ
jgi:hypothetical protein